jgi:hypothetical protein
MSSMSISITGYSPMASGFDGYEGLPPGAHPAGTNTFMFESNGPVPEGFAVVRSDRNPFTGGLIRMLARKTTGD